MLRSTLWMTALLVLVALCWSVQAGENCLDSCPDNWKCTNCGSWTSSDINRCSAPKGWDGPCNRHSKFDHKYTRYRRVQWAQNCGPIPWTACGYTKEMVDGTVPTPDLEEFRDHHEEL